MPSRPRPSLPLRWHLVRLVVGTLLPIVAFACGLFFFFARAEREAAERRVLTSARSLAEAFDSDMAGSVSTLEALAASSLLDAGHLQDFQEQCARVLKTQRGWLTVILATPDGAPLLNTSFPWGSPLPPVAEPESLARVSQTLRPVVGNLASGRGPQQRLAVPLRVPVLRDGELRFVLTAVVAAEALGDVVARQASDDVEWTRTLVDGRGYVAARTRDPARFVGRQATPSFLERTRTSHEGVYADRSLEGEPVHAAFSRTESGWTATVVSPRRVLDAAARRSLLAGGLLGLAMLLLSIIGAWALARRIERSISEAADAADALARGTPVRMGLAEVRELARLNEALERSGSLLEARERERDALLAEAEVARAEAISATRAKDAFLAMLGHELRNPLAPIVSSMERLRLRGLAETPEHEVIGRQLNHVVRLVDDLLDLARIVRGQMSLHREPVELADVVARAAEAVAPLISQRKHTLELEVPRSGLTVFGDADRLTQVVSNLLTNAAKYTPPGGMLKLWVEALPEQVCLSVEDNGEGVAPELAERIFAPFVQGPRSVDRTVGGLGIGLALVQSVVTAHGGRVELHSEGPGTGSTFTVWLPRHTAAEPPAEAPPAREERAGQEAVAAEAPLAAKPRVLLVDDNVDAAEALADLLEMSGYPVAVAHDHRQALQRLESFTPDVAILDIGLPEVDGYGVAASLRERLGEASPVFAALTGYGQREDRSRSEAAGFQHHFVKPVRLEELVAFLEQHRKSRRGAA
ncbi:hybrid sensor histidine kinase/response regulator [Pyxidicoccus xibeiensis]|uniref:hybrid sensor histidine kinase/response regulator n=1 Tax=Pyxidicoccus xibeiensis TaxID=2906759 RepID=UPI0020A795CA|nr:ATP-binding protein [Pyxidicoccus xibeiensis]MCP3139127.1 ATP-binding protein [Pyxidicoccus xibeiensis]